MYANLREAREAAGLTLKDVAAACGTDAGNLHRIELGKQVPGRELARRLYDHFEGTVELGAIYDPSYQESA